MNSKTYTALSVVVGETSLDKPFKWEINDLKRGIKKKDAYIKKLEDRIKDLKDWMLEYCYPNGLENCYYGDEAFDIEEYQTTRGEMGLRLYEGTELNYRLSEEEGGGETIRFTKFESMD